MRLQGVAITQPICDWRPFFDDASRYAFLSKPLESKKTFLKGFGFARSRSRLRLEWRPEDSVFIDCEGAVSLPKEMPDSSNVTHVFRRLFLDDQFHTRFEVGIFGSRSQLRPESGKRLDECAREFWNSPVEVRTDRTTKPLSVSEALKTLFEKFLQMSSPAGRGRNDLCYRLRPQIQVVASVLGDEVPKRAYPLGDSGQVYVALRRLNLNKRLDPLQAVYLTYSPSFVSDQEGFDRSRMIRAAIAWTHSDMEILVHMLQRCAAGGTEKGKLVLALSEFCRGLLREPELDDPNRGIILSLSDLLRALYRNEVFRFAKSLQKGKFKKAEKEGIERIQKSLATLFATAGLRNTRGIPAASKLEEEVQSIKRIEEVDLKSDHPNVRKLVARMEKSLAAQDFAAVLHSSASIFETLAKDVMENPNVNSQTLASFFDGYRGRSLLPEPVLDYMLWVYKERNITPLAAHGSLAAPNITAREAVTLCELTKSFVRIERQLAEQKSEKA